MKASGSIIILVLSVNILLAQESSFSIEEHINSLLSQGDEVENAAYYDLLIYYYEFPIDINRTTFQELNQLSILKNEQIQEIIAHRVQTGPFQSIYELQSLQSLTLNDIQAVKPFITVNNDARLSKIFSGLKDHKANYFSLGYSRIVEESRGYKESIYIGSPDRVQLRLRVRNPGKLSIGLAAQKDPGELWVLEDKNYSPDYLTGHIFLENQGRINQFAIGDYRLQFGQGLVLGSGFMAGKNVETVGAVKQNTIGIMPYSSITESNFFRGSGVNLEVFKGINLALFYSNQNLDATVTHTGIVQAVSSIRVSGMHRTSSELAGQDQLNEQVWGSAITYSTGRFQSGLTIAQSQYDKPIEPSNQPHNQFKFRGQELLNYSWFGQYTLGNFILFSEIAKTHQAGTGLNIGLLGSISKFLSISMIYRSFDRDFHSPYSQSFSERSILGNENGFYWGLKLYPTGKFIISAYFDLYQFPWITLNSLGPTFGKDYLLRLDYTFSKAMSGFIQFRSEKINDSNQGGSKIEVLDNQILKTIVSLDYGKESVLSFRSRIQYNWHRSTNESQGWLMYQDFNYDRMKIGFTARILFFDTDNYVTRQYVYEKDMLFSFVTKGLNGQGVSYYLIFKIKPLRNLSLRAKWSYTEYLNQNTIGSGYDLINSSTKNQLTAQIFYRF